MATLMTWLDTLPLRWVVIVSVWLAVAPIVPEPHLVEKLRMLLQGTLTRPLDIFDLLLHATPLPILAIKLWRMHARRRHVAPPSAGD